MLGIGYEGLALEALIDQLQTQGVEVLVDVRLNAISRKAGYSKRALSAALDAAGIRYIHDSRLGNPKDNRAAYAETTSPDGAAARDRFRQLLSAADAAEGIRELAGLAEHNTVALLCYEADESHCHRQQIIAAVRDVKSSFVGV